MIDPKTLLPEVQKMLPGTDPKEIMQGITEYQQAHPDMNNQHALQALQVYLSQQQQAAPQGKPFENLVNSVGAR